MIAGIADTLIFSKLVIFYLGIITFLSFCFTATIGFLNFRGNHIITFKWHPRMAVISLTLVFIHGIMGLSIYFGF